MDEAALLRIGEILEAAPEVYVPAHHLWASLQEEGYLEGVDAAAFRVALEQDPRFDVFAPGGTEDRPPDMPDADEDPLARWGVKLASRPLTPDRVIDGLIHNLARLNEAVIRAWEQRPQDDPATEALLREVQNRIEDLGGEIRRALAADDEREARDEEAP